MMAYSKYFFLLFLFPLCSCNFESNPNVSETDISHVQIIKVDSVKLLGINREDYFSSWRLIPLETNAKSLVGKISRISLFKKRFFLLDRGTNSVVIFDGYGKFINRIQNLGNGEGEYIGLMDFAIDEKENRIVLYSHKPYKLLYYDLNGEFLDERPLDQLYDNMSLSDNNLLMVNSMPSRKFILFSENIEADKEAAMIPMSKEASYLEDTRLITPYILKGSNTTICLPYTDTIFTFKNNKVSASYRIDFGKRSIPKDLYLKYKGHPQEFYDFATKNHYGFGLANFKESKDYAYFTYGKSTMVLYSKKTKKAISFNLILDRKTHINFSNLFAHDGDDNDLISIYPAQRFKKNMNVLKSVDAIWNEMPDSLKQLDNNLSDVSNPILMIYTLK